MSAERDRKHRFGRRLRQVRQARDLGMRAFADAVGISYSYVRALETGHKNVPPVDLLEQMAAVLKVDVTHLLHEDTELPPTDRDIAVRVYEEAVSAIDGIPLRVEGRIAADPSRWTVIRFGEGEEDRSVRVTRDMIKRARSIENLYCLLVTGDCLSSVGIWAGDYVILERPQPGQWPADRQLVAVRIDGDRTLKRWCVLNDDEIELRDADGNVAHRVSLSRDHQYLEIEGLYINYVPDAPR